jgi:hypothetical protein
LFTPPINTWDTLTPAKFKIRVHQESGELYRKPIFNRKIKKLDSKEIIIDGYKAIKDIGFYPKVSLGNNTFLLCQYKESLFGCIRPEVTSYIEIKFPVTNIIEDKLYVFKGILKINTKNASKVPYKLIDVECLNCN